MDQRMDQMQNIDITYLDLSIKTSWYPAKIDILMNTIILTRFEWNANGEKRHWINNIILFDGDVQFVFRKLSIIFGATNCIPN